MLFRVNTNFKIVTIFVSADLGKKSEILKEKRRAVSEVMSEVQEKERQKNDIIQKIQKLTEEQTKRKECKIFFPNEVYKVSRKSV